MISSEHVKKGSEEKEAGCAEISCVSHALTGVTPAIERENENTPAEIEESRVIVGACNCDRPGSVSGSSLLTEPGDKAAEAPHSPAREKARSESVKEGESLEFCSVRAVEKTEPCAAQSSVADHSTAPELKPLHWVGP